LRTFDLVFTNGAYELQQKIAATNSAKVISKLKQIRFPGDFMTGKRGSNSKNRVANSTNGSLESRNNREKKIMNCVANTSIILMSTMMGAFTEVMVSATGEMASGIAGALGGEEVGEKVEKDFKREKPEVDKKMKTMISDIRKDIYIQLGQKSKEMTPFLSDSVFDMGPKIIEKYEFKLPKLTEELDDTALSQYTKLLVNEDPNFTEMFKELTTWLNSLPKALEKTSV
jgi:hypothetical protein